MLGKKAMDEVESDFQKIKSKFMTGKKKLQISWTKRTFEELVKTNRGHLQATVPVLLCAPAPASASVCIEYLRSARG